CKPVRLGTMSCPARPNSLSFDGVALDGLSSDCVALGSSAAADRAPRTRITTRVVEMIFWQYTPHPIIGLQAHVDAKASRVSSSGGQGEAGARQANAVGVTPASAFAGELRLLGESTVDTAMKDACDEKYLARVTVFDGIHGARVFFSARTSA